MSSDEIRERALLQGLLDVSQDRLDETIRSMATDLDRLRDSWAQSYADERQASADRVAATQKDLRAWLRHRAAADGEAPNNVAPGRPDGASSVLAGIPAGHNGPERPTPDPREAELAEAERIRTMPMDQWAEERRRLIRADQGMF